MRKYIEYTKYLIKHIWYVRKACWQHGLYWQGLKHDWSKWLPVEFIPYARFTFSYDAKQDNVGYYKPTDTGDEMFEQAWFHHIRFNKHHWQYWTYAGDEGVILRPIPHKFRLEMIADWWGANMAQGHGGKIGTWYLANKEKIHLHLETRKWVEENVSDNFVK